MHLLGHKFIKLKKPKVTPVTYLVPRSSQKKNQGVLEKVLIPGLGHGKYKTNLEHSVVRANKMNAF